MFEPDIINLIRKGLAQGTPFAVFRMPGSTSMHIAGQEGYGIRINNFDAPFCEAVPVSCYESGTADMTVGPFTDDADYLANVAELVASHHGRKNEKTVLSRVITGYVDLSHIIESCKNLFAANPDAFCLMMQTADRKIWLMATPELLLDVRGSRFVSMALAGTRPAADPEAVWDEKNRVEQQIVSRYISDVLTSLRIKFASFEPETLQSNNIEHICTKFEGHLSPDTDIQTLIDGLSPTPAVCGYPVEQAKKNIARYENHKRGFYTGYTVVELPDGTTRVYVNLRCACIDADTGKYAIYVGSGITADSDPQSELIETNLKADPMRKIFAPKPVDANL